MRGNDLLVPGRAIPVTGAATGLPFVLQGLSSISNLGVSWFLVRQAGVADFGYFTIYFTVAVIVSTLAGAWVTQPLNSVASQLSDRRQEQFIVAAKLANGALNLALFALAVLAIALSWILGRGMEHVLAIGLFAIAMNVGEFWRRLAFFRRAVLPVLWFDLLRYALMILFAGAIVLNVDRPTVLLFSVAFATPYLFAALLFMALAQSSVQAPLGRIATFAQLRRLNRSGKWLVLNQGMRLIAAQFVIFVAFFALGAYQTGLIRVAQTIVGLVNPIIQGMEHVVPISLGRSIRKSGKHAAFGSFWRWAFIIVATFALLYIVIIAVSPFILRLFGIEPGVKAIVLVAGFSFGSLLNVVLTLQLFEIRAREQAELASLALFASAAIAVVMSYPAVAYLGLEGVILTVCASQFLGISMCLVAMRVKARD